MKINLNLTFVAMVMALLLIASISVMYVSAQEDFSEKELLRQDRQGSVMVDVVFLNPLEEDLDDDLLHFRVYLNTHSGDLTQYDYSTMIALKTGDGKEITSEPSWQWERSSGHHPVALLKIPLEPNTISSLISGITLEIRDLGEIPLRTFTWEKEYLRQIASGIPGSNYRVLVANAAEGSVSVLDPETQEVLQTLQVGKTVAHGIAVSPDGSRIYTGDMEAGKLVVIDSRNLQVVKELEIPGIAHGIDITPDGRYLFIAGGSAKKVVVVDTGKDQIVAELSDLGDSPSHVEFHPDGKFAYLSDPVSDVITVIEISSFRIINKIPVGAGPNESRISPDGTNLYVANWESDEIAVINLAEGKVVESISAGSGTHGVVVSPDGAEVWTANRKTNDITIIDAKNNRVIERLTAGEYANHLAFSPDGKRVYVTNARDNELMIFDAQTREMLGKAPVGDEPHEIDFIPTAR